MKKAKPVFIESLESRQHFSVSTSTTITESAKAAVLGQAFSVTAKVKPASGSTVAHGTVELLNNGKDTGLTGTLNHKGYIVFSIGAGNAIFVGDYKFSARYLSSGNFVGSKSKAISLDVTTPALATETDGLEVGTVAAGKGAAVTSGEALTVQYTGFLTSGSVFDDSAEHSPGTFTYTLNADPEQVIKGFDEGTTGMKVGETRVLVIPSALGYNDGDTRIFVIHLVSAAAAT